MQEITCARPDYLKRYGTPLSPDNLDGHMMVGFVSSRTDRAMPLEFTVKNKTVEVALPSRVLVSGADANAAAARLGLGLVQAPRYRFKQDLASGALIEVLAKFAPPPVPVSILYPSNRHLSPRIRVFIDWLASTLGPKLSAANE